MKSINHWVKYLLGIVVLTAFFITACGQKGPLVLPDTQKQDKTEKKRDN